MVPFAHPAQIRDVNEGGTCLWAAQIWCTHAPRQGESVGVVGNIFITHLPTAHSMDSILQNQRKSAAHSEPDIMAECLKLCGGVPPRAKVTQGKKREG